ncbi:related to Coenzyme Q-binding protein COQ10, mitochondrial [Saccharomycodes ludwigii]|uniref:Related to Coenzyme Q-binding protein COQ10, mitochondrial n=1 Tax=Saccharomycodes ludwigii TaxID=36035 RepID=A0A376B7C8_9ASCO|nr:related to Coenzyme Q-binding protein COQ10, mitochondrial [Saccharomycodes ludwigii]
MPIILSRNVTIRCNSTLYNLVKSKTTSSLLYNNSQICFSGYQVKRHIFGLGNITATASIPEQKYILNKTVIAPVNIMYDVVSEVSKYQEFIPYCVESFVNKRDPKTNKPIEAGLRVGFRQYDEKFVCKVICNCNINSNDKTVIDNNIKNDEVKTVVAESLTHGLFDVLYTKWTIKPHPTRTNASEVELLLKFKFHSRLYNSVSSIFAKSVTELVMNSFSKRVGFVQKQQHLRSKKL